jgi:hypothetical protein
MDIIFKFGEHFYEQGDSSIVLPLVLTILGGVLGFGTSLYFFRKDIQKAKKEEEEKEHKENQAWLKYFNHVLKSAISTFNSQMNLVDNFIENQEKDFTQLQPLMKVPRNDFNRVHDIYGKDLFHAYGYISKNEEWIKDYHNLQASFDFIEGALSDIDRMHKRNVDHAYKLLLKVKDHVDQLADELASLLTKLEGELGKEKKSDPMFQGANSLLGVYRKLVEQGAPMAMLNEEFLVPIIKFFEPYRASPIAEKFMILSKQARMKIYDAEEEMKNTVEQFKIVKEDTTEPIKRIADFEKALSLEILPN